jgi:hypothetical protein
MEGEVRVIRAPGFDADYWHCRCQGFRVAVPSGARGIVEETRFGSRLDRPDVIAVRVGRLPRRLVLVPIEEVEEINPRERLLRVRAFPGNNLSRP